MPADAPGWSLIILFLLLSSDPHSNLIKQYLSSITQYHLRISLQRSWLWPTLPVLCPHLLSEIMQQDSRTSSIMYLSCQKFQCPWRTLPNSSASLRWVTATWATGCCSSQNMPIAICHWEAECTFFLGLLSNEFGSSQDVFLNGCNFFCISSVSLGGSFSLVLVFLIIIYFSIQLE